MKFFNLCIFFICFLKSYGFGPADWIKKLTFDERNEISQACNYTVDSSSTINSSSTPSKKENFYLISEGRPVNVSNEYPFAAVLVNVNTNRTMCGASLITPRHLITCAHCMKGNTEFIIKVGGICHGIRDDCTTMDMVELEYEFALFPGGRDISKDFAIIQLKERIPRELSDRIQFVCLPKIDESLPRHLQVIGWGTIVGNQTSYILRYANMTSKLDLNEPYNCFVAFDSFCFTVNSTLTSDQTVFGYANSGDSGSAVIVGTRTAAGRHKQIGILAAGNYQLNHAVRLEAYMHDMCYYLDYCVEGAQPELQKLNMKAAFFSGNLKRSNFPAFYRLIIWSEEANQNQLDFCKTYVIQGFNATYIDEMPQILMDIPEPVQFPFAAALINLDDHRRVICGATFITNVQLITSRQCINYWLKKHFKPNLAIITGGYCIKVGPKCPKIDVHEYKIDLIAWPTKTPYLHDSIAIIQIIDDPLKSLNRIRPVCFTDAMGYHDYEPFIGYSYTYNETDRLMYGYLRMKSQCTKVMNYCTSNSFMNNTHSSGDFGNALLETTGRMTAMLVHTSSPENQHHMSLVFWHDFFCMYMNRCSANATRTVYNSIPTINMVYLVQEKEFVET